MANGGCICSPGWSFRASSPPVAPPGAGLAPGSESSLLPSFPLPLAPPLHFSPSLVILHPHFQLLGLVLFALWAFMGTTHRCLHSYFESGWHQFTPSHLSPFCFHTTLRGSFSLLPPPPTQPRDLLDPCIPFFPLPTSQTSQLSTKGNMIEPSLQPGSAASHACLGNVPLEWTGSTSRSCLRLAPHTEGRDQVCWVRPSPQSIFPSGVQDDDLWTLPHPRMSSSQDKEFNFGYTWDSWRLWTMFQSSSLQHQRQRGGCLITDHFSTVICFYP